MAKPDTLIVDGHALSWQRLCELRRQRLEAWKAAQPRQPALFELRDGCRVSGVELPVATVWQPPTGRDKFRDTALADDPADAAAGKGHFREVVLESAKALVASVALVKRLMPS
ncbi:MAG: hypothetical protein QOE96_500 [Blastocatellia bacterium]|jgi:hypothetical protein|nr:hypothetical protein [Blastocatellia bacterium]